MKDAYLCLSVDDVGLDVFSSERDLSALLDFYAAESGPMGVAGPAVSAR